MTVRTTDYLGLATDYLNQVYANLKHNNINLPLMIWLSAQTRLLAYHKGKQEVLPHVWLQGRAGIGKSYTMNRALELLPEGVVRKYKGVSPKMFTRDTTDLRHRIAFFEEADSLAQGEESAMAEDFRIAMDSGDFVFETNVNRGGEWTNAAYKREGPFLIWSTSLKNPGTQLASRMEIVSLPEPDAKAIAERNIVARRLKNDGWPTVPEQLIAHQIQLQKQADASGGIRIRFNDEASEIIGKLGDLVVKDSRAYSRILFLLQAIALTDERDIVEAGDYDTLYDLNATSAFLFTSLNAGITGDIRKVADAIAAIRKTEEDVAVAQWVKANPVDKLRSEIQLADGETIPFTDALKKIEREKWLKEREAARRGAWHSKVTSNIIAEAIKLRPTQTQEILRKAADEGWVENVGGTNKAKADWHLGPQYRPTAEGLPTRNALLGLDEDVPF